MSSLIAAADMMGGEDSAHQLELKKAERWMCNSRASLEQSFRAMAEARKKVRDDETP